MHNQMPPYGDPFYQWALSVMDNTNQLKEKQVTQTLNLTAEVQAFQDDLIDRAVRWARDNNFCETFTEAMGELFPGVPAVDSEGLDCEGNRVVFHNNGVDAAKVKAQTIAEIVDKGIRLARQYPNVVDRNTATQVLQGLFPGVRHVDSNGRGL